MARAPAAVVLVVEGDGARAARPPSARRSTSSGASRASRRRPRAPSRRSRAPARACSTRARRRPGCARSRRRRSRPAAAINHRHGLYDAVLIKENHIAMAGGDRARRCAPRGRTRPSCRSRSRCATRAEIDEALAAGAPRLLLDNMSVEELRAAVAQVAGRARARGERRRHARDAPGRRRHRRRLRVDGCTDAFGSGARPLAARGAAAVNALPMAASGRGAERRDRGAARREVRELARGARRGDPRPQLPAARDPGRRRLRRRLARALAAGGAHRGRDDRLLRRALHGRDGVDPLAARRRC